MKSILRNEMPSNLFGMSNIVLLFGIGWTVLNVYFLPFAVWTLGIVRPWFIINGLLPYKDFTWIRTPLDMFLLSFWYRIFGVGATSYQLFVLLLLVVLCILVFYTTRQLFGSKFIGAFLFYIIFLFPLFINTEEGEFLVGVFIMSVFISMWKYLRYSQLRWLFISGCIGGLVYITKQNASVIMLALFCSLTFDAYLRRNSIAQWLQRTVIFAFGGLLPVALTLSYFYFRGGLNDFLYYTVFFVLGPYAKQQPNLIHGDGLWIAAGYITLLIPFILFWKRLRLQPQIVVLLTLIVLTSLFSLLPSFLSYRAFPAFGAIALVAGFDIALLQDKTAKIVIKGIVLISFLLFIIFTFRFIQSYIVFIQGNNVAYGQFITDYGDDEKKIAHWIKTNTSKDEKIADFGNEIIYVLSDRLPKHKYIEPFPYHLQPYERSSQLFINDPPKIVIYDTSLPQIHKGLENWPFIPFMKKYYKEVGRYGDTLVIYQFST